MKKVGELKLRSISEIWHWSITSQHSNPNRKIFGTNCQRQLVRVKDFGDAIANITKFGTIPELKLFTIVWNRQDYFWLN